MNLILRGAWVALWTLLFALMSLPGMSASEYRIPLMTTPPTIDGQIEAKEWAGAMRVDGFGWQGQEERRRVTGYVGADATHLYFAVRSQLPAEGSLVADAQRDSANVVGDDSVEVWVNPDAGKDKGRCYQIVVNPLAHRFYNLHPFGGSPDDPAWQGDWTVKTSQHDGFWDCEVSIPLTTLTPGRRADEGKWSINLARNWKQEWGWSSLGGNLYEPTDQFAFISGPAPVVAQQQRADPFGGSVEDALTLTNPTQMPLTLQAGLTLTRDVMPELKQSETVTLAPGETREVTLSVQDRATKHFTLAAHVTSSDGATTYFARQIGWTAAASPWRWVTHKKVISPIDFQFAYYPYANAMRLRADVSNLPHDATLSRLTAVVRPLGGKPLKTVAFTRLKDGRQDVEFALPPLNGRYAVALKAEGKNVPSVEVVKSFERTVFPWEHKRLGESATVYPPFTPIQIQGKRLSTVLRLHQMNDGGLWDQVTALGQPLLAAPMRWGVSVEGSDAPVHASALLWTARAGNQAVAQSRWQAGGVKALVRSTWDYDGTMRVDLTLAPSGGKRVDALTLDIPLKASQATLLHAMGDSLRNTYSIRVPEGTGSVWTAAQVQSNDLPKNFCTYIYVGTPNRGLCWFAENNKGWGWDPATPNLELVRQDNQVILRVHLINKPEVLAAARTLTFGLLAAPVKPRLAADWRYKWRRDNYSLLGTDINWFALGDCGSVYPAGCDMALWQALRRGNQQHLSDAEIKEVIARGTPYFAPYGADTVQSFTGQANYNLRFRYGTKMVFYYNRASYQAAPEFQTFQDEWGLWDWRTIGPGINRYELKIVPTASYIDHALYWYGKSFDIAGNQGVYWDNWFFNGSYNTATTGAYQQPDGAIVPSTGIWGLRELSKRTFQYMNERHMPPIIMPHMTSTSILPMLSFATAQYDWEWHYSEGDFQGRFSREYILLASDGQLAGVWPVLLGDHGSQENDPWINRTFAAVAMVHELDAPFPSWSKMGQLQLALFKPVDDILQQPGVKAYRYWDDTPQPVKADDADLPTIVYSVLGKRAVFAVVSYADGDKTAHVSVDTAALGFPNGCRIVDTETGQPIPLAADNTLTFPLKKHDLRVCEVTPR